MDPQIQNQVPLESKSFFKEHKFFVILLSLFILLMVAFLGSLKLQTSSQKEVFDTQIKADDLSTWKTYRNEEYGFEIKLPKKWLDAKIVENKYPPDPSTILMIQLAEENQDEYHNVCYIIISPTEYWKVVEKEEGGGGSSFLAEENGKTYGYGCGHEDFGRKGFEEYNTAVKNGQFDLINNNSILGPFQEFNKFILPTFKLIAPSTSSDISTWKTYRNEEYGFEFKYPTSFNLSEGRHKERSYVSLEEIDRIGGGTEGAASGVYFSIEKNIFKDLASYFENLKSKTFSEMTDDAVFGDFISNTKFGNFGGYNSIEYEESYFASNLDIILILKGGFIYEISLSRFGTRFEDGKMHDQILSTFKFTN